MSDFKFPCPKCGQNILSDTSNGGMQIECPSCKNTITVPKPPPAVPVAGKLSIAKHAAPAHNPTPPPGATAAPPKPAWGAKAPVAKPKKNYKSAIISTACVIVVAAVGWFGFGKPYLDKKALEEKQKQEAAAQQAAEEKRAAAEAAEKAKRARASYSLDLANVNFPERHASGKLHGADFTVENVLFAGGNLTLRQETGEARQFVVAVPIKFGEKVDGKTFNVSAAETTSQPRVTLNWRDDAGKPPGNQSYFKGYAMKLEFGTMSGGELPGKIFLCVPDAEESFVAGDFVISPKKAATQAQPQAAPPNMRKGGRRELNSGGTLPPQ